MNRGTIGLTLYLWLPPARWLKAALAVADHELAKLCSHQWRSMSPIAIPVRARRARTR